MSDICYKNMLLFEKWYISICDKKKQFIFVHSSLNYQNIYVPSLFCKSIGFSGKVINKNRIYICIRIINKHCYSRPSMLYILITSIIYIYTYICIDVIRIYRLYIAHLLLYITHLLLCRNVSRSIKINFSYCSYFLYIIGNT